LLYAARDISLKLALNNKLVKQQSPDTGMYQGFCTVSGKLFEHIYGFLIVVERILLKYDEKNLDDKSE
jgi:hypothetical protein